MLADTTGWLVHHGRGTPTAAPAGATPYLRMFSLVTGGWVMARQALAAKATIDPARATSAPGGAKLVTARFFAEQLLPQAIGLLTPITEGHLTVTALFGRSVLMRDRFSYVGLRVFLGERRHTK